MLIRIGDRIALGGLLLTEPLHQGFPSYAAKAAMEGVFWDIRKLLILERETGIEPATNSLGSCDSTTELLPLIFVFNNFRCGLM